MRTLWDAWPVVYMRRILFWGGLALVAYGICRVQAAVASRPRAPVGWELVGGWTPWLAAMLVLAIGVVAYRSFRRISRDEREEATARAVGDMRDALGEARREGRLSAFRQRAQSRDSEGEASLRVEREQDRLRRRIDQLLSEAQVMESRHRVEVDGLRAQRDHYRVESEALAAQAKELRDALRQSHIDLGYVKDRVARLVSRRRPVLMNRVRDLLLGRTVSAQIQDLMTDLESLGQPQSPAGLPADHPVAAHRPRARIAR